ncbi:hypothetical protein P43SY_008613 [Pythium insidiosum]|uniref:VWFD domain-containing protein n=1 Tax=Pythium insidiosum TaxID=114742 RepID=A0AAD5QAP3_PYTIN|nr:hypothetical protein P43SY_008613 [Pythium insidiosum]
MNISRALRLLASVAVYLAALSSHASFVSVEATDVVNGGKMPVLGGAATPGDVIPVATAVAAGGGGGGGAAPGASPPVPVPTGPINGIVGGATSSNVNGNVSPTAGVSGTPSQSGPRTPCPSSKPPQPQPGNPSQTQPPNVPVPDPQPTTTDPTPPPTPVPTPAPAIPVVPGPAQRCSVHGDPHVSTFDNRAFDFMTTGVFRMVQAGHAQVQVFQEPCDPSPRGRRDLTCARGAAISYGSSIVRLFIQNEKLVVARGPTLGNVLNVHRLSGKTDSYRIFLAVDPTHTSFVDVTLHPWKAGNPLLNVVTQLSATMRQAHGGIMGGICGNANGKPADDEVKDQVLVGSQSASTTANLFTCTDDASCASIIGGAATAAGGVGSLAPDTGALSSEANKLRQGYQAVGANAMATSVLDTTKPAGKVTRLRQRVLRTSAAASEELRTRPETVALCKRVIDSIPICAKYVADQAYYVERVCAADADALGDLSVVDSAKLSYLRECRREVDTRLTEQAVVVADHESRSADTNANAVNNANMLGVAEDRMVMMFGDVSQCANGCSGRGECLPAGCQCASGWTGLACELSLAV